MTLPRLYAEWFQLHDILDRENYENSKWPMMPDGRVYTDEIQRVLRRQTILYDRTMVDTCCYALIPTHRICNMKNDLNVKIWTLSGCNDYSKH